MGPTTELRALQVDALRELANIAGGNAATALGQLTGRRINIAIPRLTVAPVGRVLRLLNYDDQRVVVVAVQVRGAITGRLVFLMPDQHARDLCTLLLGRPTPPGPFDDLSRSSLGEAANILGGAYVGALATMMGGAIMLSVPAVGVQPPDQILEEHHGLDPAAPALLIETSLNCGSDSQPLGGHILLVPDDGTPDEILAALKVPQGSDVVLLDNEPLGVVWMW